MMINRRTGLARLVARSQAAGQLDDEARPEDLAALLLAVVQGLAMRWSLENQSFDLVPEGERLIRVFLRPPLPNQGRG